MILNEYDMLCYVMLCLRQPSVVTDAHFNRAHFACIRTQVGPRKDLLHIADRFMVNTALY